MQEPKLAAAPQQGGFAPIVKKLARIAPAREAIAESALEKPHPAGAK